MTAPSYPSRPAMGLRLGITGARSLDAAQCPRLSAQLQATLQIARDQMRELAAKDSSVRADYLHAPGEAPQPVLRFLTPLAPGADRLAAREALAQGYTLHVPMPFPQAEYEKDFDTPEDLAEFRTLLGQAGEDWLAIDGDHGPDMNRAYEAVGRYVVRHCDILIAIWDGGPGGGRGGAADIVHYAAGHGVPVCWLHATQDLAPVWIADIYDLRYPKREPAKVETELQDYLKSRIPPPPAFHRRRHGPLEWFAHLGQSDVSPEVEHFAECPLERSWRWRGYATLIRWCSGSGLPWTPPRIPEDKAARYWFDRYEPTDARAGEYAARYRSAYVWVFLLGTLALIFGATALVLGLLTPSAAWLHTALETLAIVFTGLELAALGIILWVVWRGLRLEWHERSIDYRLLAELCRKQQVLAPLGWALPITAVQDMETADHKAPERGAWVAWLFAAEQRAAPLPRGKLAKAAQGSADQSVLKELIAEQHDYHTGRLEMAEKTSHTLESLGVWVFFAVVVFVGAKLAVELIPLVFALVHRDRLDLPGWAVLFGWLATILPGLSAAFVGIRAYAEFPLLAEQSRHMLAELERAQQRVERLDPTRPLVSQDLGWEAAAVATLMLQDLEGWARLFRVKGMEP